MRERAVLILRNQNVLGPMCLHETRSTQKNIPEPHSLVDFYYLPCQLDIPSLTSPTSLACRDWAHPGREAQGWNAVV